MVTLQVRVHDCQVYFVDIWTQFKVVYTEVKDLLDGLIDLDLQEIIHRSQLCENVDEADDTELGVHGSEEDMLMVCLLELIDDHKQQLLGLLIFNLSQEGFEQEELGLQVNAEWLF